MIRTLTGANDYARTEALQGLVAAFLAGRAGVTEMAVERLDGETATMDQLQAALHNLSFLTPHRLVIIREPSKQKAFTEQLETILQRIPETTDVILVEPKLDKRLSYYKQLKKLTDFQTFEPLDAKNIVPWIVAYAKKRGGAITANDAHYLTERVGIDQMQLKNELDKLLLAGSGITRQTIDQLTERIPQSTIFALLDAAFAGKLEHAQELYDEQRSLQVEPQAILAMLAWQMHLLALVKTAGDRSSDDIAKQAKLNPFVARKTQNLVRRLSLSQIKRLIHELVLLDVKLKTTATNADEALRLFFFRIYSATNEG